MAIWEEDFSRARAYIAEIAADAEDLGGFLMANPEVLAQAAARIRILDANPAAVELFRAGDRETFIANYHRFFAEETVPLFVDFIVKIMAGESGDRGIDVVVRALNGDALTINLSWAVAPGFEADSSRLWFYGVDVSSRLEMERKARFHREQFELLFDSMLDGFALHEMIFDEDGRPVDYRFLRVNPAFERLTGLQGRDIIGRRVLEVIPGLETEWIERYGAVVTSGHPIEFQSYSAQLDRHFAVKAFRPEAGRFACHFIDATDQVRARELEKRLHDEEKFALVGRVAGGMAHDFNNVLGVIIGTADLALEQAIPEELRTDLRLIFDTAERGRQLTGNLLLFARQPEPRMRVFDLNECVTALSKGLHAELDGVGFTLDLAPDLAQGVADVGMLENAIGNLIQNAVHATRKTSEPRVEVRTRQGVGSLVVEVEDNGCGIPARAQARVFEPTFTLKGRADEINAYPDGVEGSGYGLANVRRCMDCHHGTVSFTSAPGRGSVFRLDLPMVEAPPAPAPATERNGQAPATRGSRILVVEDEEGYALVLERALRRHGYEVTVANSVTSAMALLAADDFELLSLDHLLPDGDGLGIYAALRDMGATVPVLFVSGNMAFNRSLAEIEQRDPLVGHIPKPFTPAEYVRQVQEMLERGSGARPRPPE